MIASIYVNAHAISMLYNYCEENDNLRAPFLTMQDIRFLLAHMEMGCKKRYGGSSFVRFIPGIFDSYTQMRTGISDDDDPSKRFATRRVSKLEFIAQNLWDDKWDKMVDGLEKMKTNKMTTSELKEVFALENMDFLYSCGRMVKENIRPMSKVLYTKGVTCGLYFYGQNTEVSIAPIPAENRKHLGEGLRQNISKSMVDIRFLDKENAIFDSHIRRTGDTFSDIEAFGLAGYSFDGLVKDMKYAIEVFNKRGFSKMNRELWLKNNGEFMEQTGRKHYLINFLEEYEEKIEKSTDEDEKKRYQELIDITKRSFVQELSERTN